jgi:hypothetical protein
MFFFFFYSVYNHLDELRTERSLTKSNYKNFEVVIVENEILLKEILLSRNMNQTSYFISYFL